MTFDLAPSQPEQIPLVAENIATEIMETAMRSLPNPHPPQTTSTEWSTTDTEQTPAGIVVAPSALPSPPQPITESQPEDTRVTLPERSGVASSIHNPANAMILDDPLDTSAPIPLPTLLPTPPSVGEEVAKALDPVFPAIMTTLARLTLAVELLGPQTRPSDEIAGRGCSATSAHTQPVKAPVRTPVADTRLQSSSVPARGETRAPAASEMPNVRLPDSDGGAMPPHQPKHVGTTAKANGAKTPAAATVGPVQTDLGDAFLALPSRPKLSKDSVPTLITWAGVVTPKVVKDSENARAFIKVAVSHRPSQGKAKANGNGETTRVVVICDGGMEDEAEETRLRTERVSALDIGSKSNDDMYPNMAFTRASLAS